MDYPDDSVFIRRESAVRSYCRGFPAVFDTASGPWLTDERGRRWLDFLAGAGALNYGHNDPVLVEAVVEHLRRGGIGCSLDLYTTAKRRFLRAVEDVLLTPRGLNYRVQFTGPTGTNAVEAAFKLARKVTGRTVIAAFRNGYHGMSLGALAATGNSFARAGAGVPLANTVFLPFDGGAGDAPELLKDLIADHSSGFDVPAAVVVETVQGEGGLNVASPDWLRRLHAVCRAHGILLIVDDIQAGCGRTGGFFSFERAGIEPDLVVLSKSLSGLGQPMSVVLIRPDLDRWRPGEHNGTFRGNNLAFVSATVALETYWSGPGFAAGIAERGRILEQRLAATAARHPALIAGTKGLGLMRGLNCADERDAARIAKAAFARGLVIERCGPDDEVVKAMPPLNIPLPDLARGLDILDAAVDEVASSGAAPRPAAAPAEQPVGGAA